MNEEEVEVVVAEEAGEAGVVVDGRMNDMTG
jgi:hypothetical protein